MRKSNLTRYQILTAASASTSLTSAVTNIQFLDNVGIEVDLSGAATAAGTFTVQVSNSYLQDDQGNVQNTGVWTDVTTQAIASSTPTPIFFNLTGLAACFIRLTYTRTSGTTTVNAYISGKMV